MLVSGSDTPIAAVLFLVVTPLKMMCPVSGSDIPSDAVLFLVVTPLLDMTCLVSGRDTTRDDMSCFW